MRTAMEPSTFDDAQRDMRHAYFGGAPGLLASSLVWLVAGAVALKISPQSGVLALFFGGMAIHPVGMLIAKALGRAGTHTKGNPLGALALENTFQFLLSLMLAFAISAVKIAWFFPAMLLLIGGRYLVFATLYGTRLYWACGGALSLAGIGLAMLSATPPVAAFVGGAIELAFAGIVFSAARRDSAS